MPLVRWRMRCRVEARCEGIQRVARCALGRRVHTPATPTAPAVASITGALDRRSRRCHCRPVASKRPSRGWCLQWVPIVCSHRAPRSRAHVGADTDARISPASGAKRSCVQYDVTDKTLVASQHFRCERVFIVDAHLAKLYRGVRLSSRGHCVHGPSRRQCSLCSFMYRTL